MTRPWEKLGDQLVRKDTRLYPTADDARSPAAGRFYTIDRKVSTPAGIMMSRFLDDLPRGGASAGTQTGCHMIITVRGSGSDAVAAEPSRVDVPAWLEERAWRVRAGATTTSQPSPPTAICIDSEDVLSPLTSGPAIDPHLRRGPGFGY